MLEINLKNVVLEIKKHNPPNLLPITKFGQLESEAIVALLESLLAGGKSVIVVPIFKMSFFFGSQIIFLLKSPNYIWSG